MGNELKTSTGQFADHNAIMQRCLHDPVFFVREILGGDPWDKQEEVLRAVATYKRTSVRSGHGLGKSKAAAWVTLWFLCTHPDSVVITTAPTFNQVQNILWREIKTAYVGAKFPLGNRLAKVLNTEISFGEKWFAMGLSTDKPERFQGFHAESGYILLVCDEASGIAQPIFDAAEGFLTSQGSRMLMIGNPTKLDGEFCASFKSTQYHKIHMSAFDSPNVKAGKVIRPYLITPEWIDDKRIKWGEDNPLWYSRVLGEFPQQSDDTLISLSDIESAQQRYDSTPPGFPNILSCDPARYGSDATVMFHRQGNLCKLYSQIRKHDTMEVAGAVIRAMRETGAVKVQIDPIGIGSGVYDRLKEQNIKAVPMNVAEHADDKEMFLNKRAEWYWLLRTAFKERVIAIPPDDELAAQLAGIKYEFTSKGQIQIESKDDMKKRSGGVSPDKADALMLVWANKERKQFFIGRA